MAGTRCFCSHQSLLVALNTHWLCGTVRAKALHGRNSAFLLLQSLQGAAGGFKPTLALWHRVCQGSAAHCGLHWDQCHCRAETTEAPVGFIQNSCSCGCKLQGMCRAVSVTLSFTHAEWLRILEHFSSLQEFLS